MLAASLRGDGGKWILLLVLEPGNIEKLKSGQPIHKFVAEFLPELGRLELLIAYSPDVTWVAEQLKGSRDATKLSEILEQSLSRPEVLVRGKSAEDLRKEF